jgi:hypothetical protein
MSRSGYTDDFDNHWELIRWRGAVKSAIRGKRGQDFLRELIAALDALPEKKLIPNAFAEDGCVCALGAVARLRGTLDKFADIDPDDIYPEGVARDFGLAHALAAEIMYENDEGTYRRETPEERWERMRAWAVKNLKEGAAP